MENTVIFKTLLTSPGKNLVFTDPVQIITTTKPEAVAQCLQQLATYTSQGYYAAGFIAYECGCLFDQATMDTYRPPETPLLWFGIYNTPQEISIKKTFAKYTDHHISELTMPLSPDKYQKNIEKIKNYLRQGDTYQINFTTHYTGTVYGDILFFFAQLCQAQKVDYAAYIQFAQEHILSVSPELFFSLQNKQIIVKPMKGTANRSLSKEWLQNDEKNLSENRMICDLLRNDLGKISVPGSVKVTKAFTVEEYKTLWQMTSTITSTLENSYSVIDIIKTLFPCGSITGAPKVRSMQIIHELDPRPRGIYTGAIGYITPEQDAVFNVAIRTIHAHEIEKQKYIFNYGIGSGITIDSDPEQEYAECQLKAKTLEQLELPFGLIETMRCENGHVPLLNKHLERLQKSAHFFGIPFLEHHIQKSILDYCQHLTDRQRVRLELSSTGNIALEHQTLHISHEPIRIGLSKKRTHSENIFLKHKTTKRDLYTEEYTKAAQEGLADIIFMNERDELTEGAISNIFIKKAGAYFTPPLNCGILPGIQRAVFMETHAVTEKALSLNDLVSADEIIITNAVRGARQAVLK